MGNIIPTFKLSDLKKYLLNGVGKNPILEQVDKIDNNIKWNEDIFAKDAFKFMKRLELPNPKGPDNFNNWAKNKWTGWYLEGLYSDYFKKNPSNNLIYMHKTKPDTINDYEIVRWYNHFKYDNGR